MSRRVNIINGKGDWTDEPPTGVDDHDWQASLQDFISQAGVVDLAGGDAEVTEIGTPAMKVEVAAGRIYVENSSWTQNSFEPKYYTVTADDSEELDISSNPSGSTRIDLICQKIDKITTPNDTASNVAPLIVVEGTPGAGVPATPADHEALAEVTVASGASSIVNANINDVRRQVQLDVALIDTSTLVTLTGTQTLTNKRITKRVGTVTSSTTPTPSADSHDVYTVTALAAGATFGAPTGTPTEGQGLIIRIKDNGTARTLAWNAIYRAIGFELPTTTVISKTMYLGFIYNATDSKWDLLAVSQEV